MTVVLGEMDVTRVNRPTTTSAGSDWDTSLQPAAGGACPTSEGERGRGLSVRLRAGERSSPGLKDVDGG